MLLKCQYNAMRCFICIVEFCALACIHGRMRYKYKNLGHNSPPTPADILNATELHENGVVICHCDKLGKTCG